MYTSYSQIDLKNGNRVFKQKVYPKIVMILYDNLQLSDSILYDYFPYHQKQLRYMYN